MTEETDRIEVYRCSECPIHIIPCTYMISLRKGMKAHPVPCLLGCYLAKWTLISSKTVEIDAGTVKPYYVNVENSGSVAQITKETRE